MGKKIALVLGFIIVLLVGFLGGYFVAKKTSFSFSKQNKLSGVWSSGNNNYLVIQEDGTFYLLNIGMIYENYDYDGTPTSDPIYILGSATTGHINSDMTIVYNGRFRDNRSINTAEEGWAKQLMMVTPLDQLDYEEYASNSSIAIIDDTTIEVNGNLTFLKKTDEISMNFRDFID